MNESGASSGGSHNDSPPSDARESPNSAVNRADAAPAHARDNTIAPNPQPPAPNPQPAALTQGREKTIGRLSILAAALLWSTSGLFAKAPLFDNWPDAHRGPLLAFWRALFASLVLVPMVRRPRWSLRLVPMVLAFAVMNFTYLSAMALTEASNAIWLQNTAPVWVFLAGALLLREPPQPRDWMLLALGACGVGLILTFELPGASRAGVIYGLLSGLFYAAVVVSLRQLRDYESVFLVAINHVFTAIVLAPYAWYQSATNDVWPSGMQWWFLAGFGILQMGLPYLLFARGLRHVSGHEASGITLLEPVLVPLWVFVAWHSSPTYQPPRWWTMVGGALIFTGLVVRYARAPRRHRS